MPIVQCPFYETHHMVDELFVKRQHACDSHCTKSRTQSSSHPSRGPCMHTDVSWHGQVAVVGCFQQSHNVVDGGRFWVAGSAGGSRHERQPHRVQRQWLVHHQWHTHQRLRNARAAVLWLPSEFRGKVAYLLAYMRLANCHQYLPVSRCVMSFAQGTFYC